MAAENTNMDRRQRSGVQSLPSADKDCRAHIIPPTLGHFIPWPRNPGTELQL